MNATKILENSRLRRASKASLLLSGFTYAKATALSTSDVFKPPVNRISDECSLSELYGKNVETREKVGFTRISFARSHIKIPQNLASAAFRICGEFSLFRVIQRFTLHFSTNNHISKQVYSTVYIDLSHRENFSG